jgi:myo-inositol-1(or 4)-monophosphatase
LLGAVTEPQPSASGAIVLVVDRQPIDRWARVCEEAARLGGKIVLEFRGHATVREKSPQDLVTEADLASQQAIRAFLHEEFPDYGILSEEGFSAMEAAALNHAEYCWVVDPLDGTTNFIHQLPYYSVAVALVSFGKPIAAAIFDPEKNECFTAARGMGSRLNGVSLRTSSIRRLSEAMVAASLPPRVDRHSEEVSRFLTVLELAGAVRRLGSAALNLCYVAAGRLDAYWATSVHAWDLAPGMLVVREAGGVVAHLTGGPPRLDDPRFLAAANGQLQQELAQALHRAIESTPHGGRGRPGQGEP